MNIRLTSSQLEFLKHLSLLLMLVDHVVFLLYGWEHYLHLHLPGRLVYPILAFLLAYNYIHNATDTRRYSQRLLLFALIAQLPYWFFFESPTYEVNIFVTLWAGIMLLRLQDEKDNGWSTLRGYFSGLMIFVFAVFLLFQPFSIYGPLSVYISAMYLRVDEPMIRAGLGILLVVTVCMLNVAMGWLYCLAGLSSLLIVFLVSRLDIRWVRVGGLRLYWFYPVHLVVLKAIFLINQSAG